MVVAGFNEFHKPQLWMAYGIGFTSLILWSPVPARPAWACASARDYQTARCPPVNQRRYGSIGPWISVRVADIAAPWSPWGYLEKMMKEQLNAGEVIMLYSSEVQRNATSISAFCCPVNFFKKTHDHSWIHPGEPLAFSHQNDWWPLGVHSCIYTEHQETSAHPGIPNMIFLMIFRILLGSYPQKLNIAKSCYFWTYVEFQKPTHVCRSNVNFGPASALF